MFAVRYSYDNNSLNDIDITRYLIDGYTMTVQRNRIGTLSLKILYRNLDALCEERSITLDTLLTEWFSNVYIFEGDDLKFTGVLDSFPSIAGAGLDEEVTLTFQSWLGLLQLAPVTPLQDLSGNLDRILVSQVASAVAWSSDGRAQYPIKIGRHVDSLNVVQWKVDQYMNVYEFITQRCDNTTGAGQFDINITPRGMFEIWSHFGYDLSGSIIFSFGAHGANVEEWSFPAWSKYYTDCVETGAGNGFGAGGTTLVSNQYNSASRKRHYRAVLLAQDSGITTQSALDVDAAKRLKYSARPNAVGEVKFNATRLGLRVREHDEHGDIWVGDTVRVQPMGIYENYPTLEDGRYRIDRLEVTVSGLGVESVTASFVDPSGGDSGE